MTGCIDEKELLVYLVRGVVYGAVFIRPGQAVCWEGTFDREGGLGSVGFCILSSLELYSRQIVLVAVAGP